MGREMEAEGTVCMTYLDLLGTAMYFVHIRSDKNHMYVQYIPLQVASHKNHMSGKAVDQGWVEATSKEREG